MNATDTMTPTTSVSSEEVAVFKGPGLKELAECCPSSIGYRKLPELNGVETGYERLMYCVTSKWQGWVLLEWAWIVLRDNK